MHMKVISYHVTVHSFIHAFSAPLSRNLLRRGIGSSKDNKQYIPCVLFRALLPTEEP